MLKYLIIGFFAQLIDGTMGMAYGISARTFLRSFAGLDTVAASVVVHCSEVFTSLASGISHYKLKNYMKENLLKLAIPGAIGGFLGSWFLTSLGNKLEIFIDVYLIVMGFKILSKALKKEEHDDKKVHMLPLLGLVGGFLDATGGGGWGPVVTASLVSRQKEVKKVIGTVNIAEFIVTIVETTTFVIFFRGFKNYLNIILGIIIGGVIAAPIAAVCCKKAPVKQLMVLIGVLLITLYSYTLYGVIFH
ncbi:MAG: sulfite exporter TauE/SafE family protein [Lachnospiraceae bacterium]|nr:sulfite exporter TauE/SafE family protein [Lachnospiraceae bacterium]